MNTSEFFTDEVLQKWNNLMPSMWFHFPVSFPTSFTFSSNQLTEGMGFQWVNNTEKYNNLPHPIDWYEGMTVFTTSVTHQIHCLVCSSCCIHPSIHPIHLQSQLQQVH